MIQWITGIGSFVTGFASCGLIQFFVNRSDSRKEKLRQTLADILQKTSAFGIVLHEAYDKWYENIYQLGQLLDEHIEVLNTYIEQVNLMEVEQQRLLEKHKECFCAHAPTCPHKILGELPKELSDFLDSRLEVFESLSKSKKDFENNCFNILADIIQGLNDYKDFLNKLPETYTLPQKHFKKIYPALSNIEFINVEILERIRKCKAEPQSMVDNDFSLGKPLSSGIIAVEDAKLVISQQISKI